MKIVFCDSNKSLVNKVRVAVKDLPKGIVRCYVGSVFSHKGVYVSASNPVFSMGGGLDAQIAKRFKKECSQIMPKKGNQRIGNVCFTVTVDKHLEANSSLVRSALRFALKNTQKETLIVSGLGTGIGGLKEDEFVRLFVQAIRFFTQSKKLGRPVKQSNLRWKFLRTGLISDYDKKTKWTVGKWKTIEGKVNLCNQGSQPGFHCSKTILQALGYVKGEVLAQVEVKGNSYIGSDKEAYSEMRVVKAYAWTKEFSVKLAIFSAEQVIKIYEDKYPGDDRPRKAIEAAKKWLKNPSARAARAADRAADAAYAAYAAGAAGAAARAADAAYAAYAAGAAARAADRAAYAAGATDRAADAAVIEKINTWIETHVKELKVIK